MVRKDFYINRIMLVILLSLLSLVILVGAIVAAVLFVDAEFKVLMIVILIELVVAYAAIFFSKKLSCALYGINALLTIVVFVVFAASYPVSRNPEVCAVLLLFVLDLVCMWVCCVWSAVVSVNGEVVFFQGVGFKKYLICRSIDVVRRGLFHTVTIKTASGKIRVPFVNDVDQLVDCVLNARLEREDVTVCE